MLRPRVDTRQSRLVADRTAAIVIRMWTEEAEVDDPLRARISLVPGLDGAATTTVVAAGTDELLVAVRGLADDFAARRDAAVTPGTETPRR